MSNKQPLNMFHPFNWKYFDVQKVVPHLQEQGFNAILLSPVQSLKEYGFLNWWMCYQPTGFVIGNQYGSKENLIETCQINKEHGIETFMDVVLTHVGEKVGSPLVPHENVEYRLTSRPDFWKERRNIENWQDRYQVTSWCAGLPSLNLANHDLQDIVIEFLNELIDCGVDGFRIDSAKSIALPNENNDFFPRVLGSLKKKDLSIYGEILFADEKLLNQYLPYIGILSDGCHDKENSVAFAESHDTYFGFEYTRNLSDREITQRYRERGNEHKNVLYYARPWSGEWESTEVRDANYNREPVKQYRKTL